MSVKSGKNPVKKEPLVRVALDFEKKYGSKDIPQTQLHLPTGWKIRTGHKSALQRRVELIGRAITVVRNRDWLKVPCGGGVFPYTPFTADQVSKVYKVNAELQSIPAAFGVSIQILKDTQVKLAIPWLFCSILFSILTSSFA
jgi:hypothetical protein